jgi:peptide/nickel transport system permease protein
MLSFVGRKLLSGVVLLFVVSAAVFVLVFSQGTNTARQILGQSATQDQVTAKVQELGLDQPVLVQYAKWLGNLFTGSLGTSYYTGEEVTDVLVTRIPVTVAIIAITLVLMAIVSVLLGALAAVRGGWVDRVVQVVGIGGAAVPNFIVAIVLVFLFAIWIPLFPATGYVSPDESITGWISCLVLPVTAILIGQVANSAQLFRGAMIDVLKQDYIRTLRARGINESLIVFRHALRNAAPAGLTILSLQTIALLGATVVIEQIFALPGMGLLTLTASIQGDIPVVMGCVLFTIVVVVIVNIAVDLVNGWINPKVRMS